ncbi:MAG: hypothetical protein ACYSTS_15515 [Planctomycetota bacterium]
MNRLTPIKAIWAKCKECSGNQLVVIRKCQIADCPLYPYRMGRRPIEKSEQIETKATG